MGTTNHHSIKLSGRLHRIKCGTQFLRGFPVHLVPKDCLLQFSLLRGHIRHLTRALTPAATRCTRSLGHDGSYVATTSSSKRTPTISSMPNWHDPALLLRENLVITKLYHAIASLYIWETVFTAGFELNALRGKQPYGWTIWLYLGTRYTCLLTFILFFIQNDAGQVPCQPLVITSFALSYASWAFASLIIVLRITAIWNRNTIVSSIALFMWLAGLGVSIRTLTMIESTYDPVVDTCVVLRTHILISAAATILAADVTLLVVMLIGLLRHAQRSSAGIWHLLYKQCIIWMILAAVAEIPPVVFLILNLNDVWNQMFLGVGITILSICAARMYRSLSKHGSLTEYSYD
ncbi:hypothetical protein H4582DRAFT_1536949 [Lactarius indigo]|nr:hypothetical protein H4582DRAFT_1536949 [Lactarius indigo]